MSYRIKDSLLPLSALAYVDLFTVRGAGSGLVKILTEFKLADMTVGLGSGIRTAEVYLASGEGDNGKYNGKKRHDSEFFHFYVPFIGHPADRGYRKRIFLFF
jgi:hypothetical protein